MTSQVDSPKESPMNRFSISRVVLFVPFIAVVLYGLIFFFLLQHPGYESEAGPIGAEAARGREIWRRHNCSSCHSLYGLGGFLGPDLTRLARTRSAGYMQSIIRNGNGLMPAFDLGKEESAALYAFFQYLAGDEHVP